MLSDITIFSKYAKFIPEFGRREDWQELITRNLEMHKRKHPDMSAILDLVYKSVYDKKILPSMRSLQFSGLPIELANNRLYNCAYMPIDHMDAFSELMLLLLGGSGLGYSVQSRHVSSLPNVQGPSKEKRRFLIGDSIEGWADSVKILVEAHFLGKSQPIFDYRDIREKGAALITTGGKAPGPDPLQQCLERLDTILSEAVGTTLSSLDVHDMSCIIADAVLTGGIRRAALICLFDRWDEDMMDCKSGAWWEYAPWRGRANNSAVLPRSEVEADEFYAIMGRVKDGGNGEPGVYWTSNSDWGANPCAEIALKPFQFCNLVEIDASTVTSQEDLNSRASHAAIIATVQASYTDFHYLRPIWKKTTEEDALIGVGITGIASGNLEGLNLEEAAINAVFSNDITASKLGINYATRVTTIKPSGTSSMVLGCSSGIHAWHSPYYIRRMRLGRTEALYHHLVKHMPHLLEDDVQNPSQVVASFPQKAPEGANLRNESPLDLLERVGKYNREWVGPGHIKGDNRNNVSCTISIKDDEWDAVTEWMWYNRKDYNGIAVLPFDGGNYEQAPFEEITKEEYYKMLEGLEAFDINEVKEHTDNTDLASEPACAGGLCDLV